MKTFEFNFTKFTLCPYRLRTKKGERIYLGLKDCEECRYYKGGSFDTVNCSHDEEGGAE